MKRLEIFVVMGILGLCAVIIYVFSTHGYYAQSLKDYTYDIGIKWDLPDALEEVSGITYLGDSLVAAIQDENGVIYIYDLGKIEVRDTINFAEDGDFEGIAIHDKDAYVMRSDGLLFEIANYKDSIAKTVKMYQTIFNESHNVESLTLDEDNNRLLVIAKDRDPSNTEIKGVYAFSLSNKQMSKRPVFTINLEDDSFAELRKNRGQNRFRPSDIAIHPITKELYILEGSHPKLMILSPDGKFKKLQLLNPDDFQQPEGITFSPNGTLYISNEMHTFSANIVEVILKETETKVKN